MFQKLNFKISGAIVKSLNTSCLFHFTIYSLFRGADVKYMHRFLIYIKTCQNGIVSIIIQYYRIKWICMLLRKKMYLTYSVRDTFSIIQIVSNIIINNVLHSKIKIPE